MGASVTLAGIVGQTVEEIFAGPSEERPGTELPGIAGAVWSYTSLLIRLADASVLSLDPGSCRILPEVPSGSTPCELLDANGQTCLGKRIVDLAVSADGEPDVYLFFEGGFYLNHCHLPGGSSVSFGNLREWDARDRETGFVSLITTSS